MALLFQEEVKKEKLLTHDVWRRPIAKGHLSDSGEKYNSLWFYSKNQIIRVNKQVRMYDTQRVLAQMYRTAIANTMIKKNTQKSFLKIK